MGTENVAIMIPKSTFDRSDGSISEAAASGGSAIDVRHGRAIRNYLTIIAFGIVSVLGYFFSVWFLTAYSEGDQIHYNQFWMAVRLADPSMWSDLQLMNLSSSEPVFRYIIGFGTYFDIGHTEFISICNGIFLGLLAIILIRNKASIPFSVFLFSNYYLLVLLGPAERLKFAYFFMVLAFAIRQNSMKLLSAALSVLSHTQALVQFVSSATYYFLSNFNSKRFNKIQLAIIGIGSAVAFAIVVFYIFRTSANVIADKSDYYGQESQGIFEALQWLYILIFGVIIFDKKFQFFVGMLPMGALTAMYGNRINIATFAFFCGLAMVQRKTNNGFVLAVMAYMSFKSIGFMQNVFATGQGF